MTHVTSVSNITARNRLNVVIDSLDRFVSETTNDVTEQSFGTVRWCGNIYDGQTICTGQKPRFPNVAVFGEIGGYYTYVGNLEGNGNIAVQNPTVYKTEQSICSGVTSYTLGICNVANDISIYCNTTFYRNRDCCVTDRTSGVTSDGWCYTTYCTQIQCTVCSLLISGCVSMYTRYFTCGCCIAIPEYYWCTCWGDDGVPVVLGCFCAPTTSSQAYCIYNNTTCPYICINDEDGTICDLGRLGKVPSIKYGNVCFYGNAIRCGLCVWSTSTYCCVICKTIYCRSLNGCRAYIDQKFI